MRIANRLASRQQNVALAALLSTLLALSAGCGGGAGPQTPGGGDQKGTEKKPAQKRLLSAGPGKGAAAAPSGDAIKIGVVGPMTGDQAKNGGDLKNGAELCVADWNAKGGVLGKKIEMLIGDDQHDLKQAVSVANKFVSDGVAGVVGHFNSSCSIPASDVYLEGKIVMITPASTNPQLTDGKKTNVFRVCGRDDQQGMVAAEHVANVVKPAKVAVLHDKTTYGQGLADEFKKQYEAKSGKKVDLYEAIVQGDKDFSAVLTKIKALDPGIIFFGGIYPEGGLLVRQARQQGIKGAFFSGDGVIDKEFVKIAGAEAAEGTLLTFTPDQSKVAEAQDLIKRYKEKYGEVGPYSLYSYTACQILLEGIQKAGGTDMDKVSAAIRGAEHSTALGKIKFDDKGDVLVSPYVVYVTKGGEFVQLTGLGGGAAPAAP
ncbi:MAG: branched-chain amino acid ABC transporter substrate-binding protein [Acidobacteriota bacterium]